MKYRYCLFWTAITSVLSILNSNILKAEEVLPSTLMSYQGYLKDALGVPLGNVSPANYDIVFRIYDSEVGSNILWSEMQTVVLSNGNFSVKLGEGSSYLSEPRPNLDLVFTTAAPSGQDRRYIGLSILGVSEDIVEILPRLELLTIPYSFLASHAVVANRIVSGDGDEILVTSGVNVGIGQANPSYKLDVNGGIHASDGILTEGDFSVVSIQADDTQVPVLTTQNGQVGIGVVNPEAPLHVSGGIQSNGSINVQQGSLLVRPIAGNEGVTIKTAEGVSPESNLSMQISSTQAYLKPSGSQVLELGGTAGISTQSIVANSANVGYLHSRGNIFAEGSYSQSGDKISFANGYGWVRRDHSNRSTRVGGANLGNGGREASYDGDSNWDFYSDIRMKKEIIHAEPFLDRIMQTPIRRFRWKTDVKSESAHMLGVIAQEIEPLYPDLVTKSKNEQGIEQLAVGYTSFGVVALKGIQELKHEKDAEIEALKQEISQLKQMVLELAQ